MSPSDIAELAGVSRAAVSNWRKRSEDFPPPIGGTAAKPLFDRSAVVSWLQSRGYEIHRDPRQAVWAALNTLRGTLTPEESIEAFLWLACLKKAGSDPNAAAVPWGVIASVQSEDLAGLLREAAASLDSAPEVAALYREPRRLAYISSETVMRMVDVLDAVATDDLGAAADYALERLASSQGRSGGEYGFVGSRVSELLARLAAQHPGGTLYDPACGVGSALLLAVREDRSRERVVGRDISESAVTVARQRALLRDQQVDLAVADVLLADPDPDLLADVVVAEPPIGLRWDAAARVTDSRFAWGMPPAGSADLAWVQHVVAHLAPSGRGYVVTSRGPLFRGGPERQIRAELLRHGCVEGIVGLPGKLLPHITVPLALWVLRAPSGQSDDQVLIIDASGESDPETKAPAWLRTPAVRPAASTRVGVKDILAADSDLSPQRWTDAGEPAPGKIEQAYEEGLEGIEKALRHLTNSVGVLKQLSSIPSAHIVTVGDLVAQGAIEMRPGKPEDRYSKVPGRYRDRIVHAANVKTRTMPGDPPNGGPDDPADLTQDGDVLVTTMHTVRAVVDETGGNLPSTGVYRLRVTSEALSPGYLAAVLAGPWNNRFQAGSTISRAEIRKLEVPLIPVQAQRDVALFALGVGLINGLARELAAHAEAVEHAFLNAVRYGTPLPTHPDASLDAAPEQA